MLNEAMILFWWFLFGGSHIIGSSVPVRSFLIGRIGILGFKVVYSLTALVTFLPLCSFYFARKHTGHLLFTPTSTLQMATQILMFAALIVLLQGLSTSNPMTTRAELTGKFKSHPRGIQRVTRHPQNLSFAIFGFAHLLSNPYVGDWIFFGGFIVYAILSALHQDRRTLATGPEQTKRFQDNTSFIPFSLILSGHQRLALKEYNIPALLAAIVTFILLRLFHAMLFGGFGA